MSRKDTVVMVTDSYAAIGILITEVLISEGYDACYCSEDCLMPQAIRSAQLDLLILELRPANAERCLQLIDQLRRHDMDPLPADSGDLYQRADAGSIWRSAAPPGLQHASQAISA